MNNTKSGGGKIENDEGYYNQKNNNLSSSPSSTQSSSLLNNITISTTTTTNNSWHTTTPSRRNTCMIKKGWKKGKENLQIDDEFALFHPGEDVDEIVQGKEELLESPSVRRDPAIWDENYEEEEEIIEQGKKKDLLKSGRKKGNYKGKEEGEEGEDVRMTKDFDVNFLEDDDEVDWDGVIKLDRRNIFRKNASVQSSEQAPIQPVQELSFEEHFFFRKPSWKSIPEIKQKLIMNVAKSIMKRSANTPHWVIEKEFHHHKSEIPYFSEFFTTYKHKDKTCIKLHSQETYHNATLQKELTKLIMCQKNKKSTPSKGVTIKTVQRHFRKSFKQIQNEIRNFNEIYKVTGGGSIRFISLRNFVF
jgi:hypothetical protein